MTVAELIAVLQTFHLDYTVEMTTAPDEDEPGGIDQVKVDTKRGVVWLCDKFTDVDTNR